jgi:DNA sulfur modification protein DndB
METNKESILRVLFDKLQSDSHSALHGKLSPARSVPNRISRVTFNRGVGIALNSDATRSLKEDDIYRLLRNYINAFDAELFEKGMLVKAAYFEALFEIFDEIVRATMNKRQNLKQESLQEVIRPVAKLDFAGKGGLTKRGYTELIQTAFRSEVAVSADMLWFPRVLVGNFFAPSR